MKYYFQLQIKMLSRQLTALGIHPVLAIIILLPAFTGLSLLLFAKTEYAGYIYVLTALSLLTGLSETRRNDFLRTCFTGKSYRLVRIAENAIVTLPFIIFLLYKMLFVHAGIALVFSALMAVFTSSKKSDFTLPTPFGRRPFEFTAGFRSTFLLLILAYLLLIISIRADNFNLGIFALILVFLVCFTYYLNPENEFYIWIFSCGPAKFLAGKIATAMLYSGLLSLPVFIGLLIFYPDKALIIAGFQALAFIYLGAVILAKYSSYPSQLNLPQLVLISLSVWFPPALLVVIPFFYVKSFEKLKPILG